MHLQIGMLLLDLALFVLKLKTSYASYLHVKGFQCWIRPLWLIHELIHFSHPLRHSPLFEESLGYPSDKICHKTDFLNKDAKHPKYKTVSLPIKKYYPRKEENKRSQMKDFFFSVFWGIKKSAQLQCRCKIALYRQCSVKLWLSNASLVWQNLTQDLTTYCF